MIAASEFDFDPVNLICRCPANQVISHRGIRSNSKGQQVAYFEGKLLQCRNCNLKHQCMQNPSAADHRKGAGRQVSFVLNTTRKPTYTDWMKQRVDSAKGKLIYSHRMSVVEPVFGNLTNNKGLKRFSLRTQSKVQAQWQLFCMIHNIEKLKNYGQLQ